MDPWGPSRAVLDSAFAPNAPTQGVPNALTAQSEGGCFFLTPSNPVGRRVLGWGLFGVLRRFTILPHVPTCYWQSLV